MSELYKGNTYLKNVGVQYPYTKEEIEEFIRCAKDPVYFAQNYVYIVHADRGLEKLNLYDYQLKYIDHLNNNRNSICLWTRQSGKCVEGSTLIKIIHEEKEEVISMEEFWNKFQYE